MTTQYRTAVSPWSNSLASAVRLIAEISRPSNDAPTAIPILFRNLKAAMRSLPPDAGARGRMFAAARQSLQAGEPNGARWQLFQLLRRLRNEEKVWLARAPQVCRPFPGGFVARFWYSGSTIPGAATVATLECDVGRTAI